MSAPQWKPGDVVTFGGSRALRTAKGWAYGDGSIGGLHQDAYDNARALVVIDPEDREQVDRLWAVMDKHQNSLDYDASEDEVIAATQAALRSLIADPKPDEPQGLGAVVENDQGRRFIRQHDGWWRGDEPCTLNWAAVHAVRVLSEGWSE